VKYSNAGYAKVKGKVINASEAIFTPCAYEIKNVQVLDGNVVKPISEVGSFRGRFCEQAEKGETIVAQGKLEQVRNKEGQKYFRLLLGNTPSDFMTLA